MSKFSEVGRGSAAPAGWYEDGSGRQRWWDGRQWTEQFREYSRRRRSRHLLWSLSPAYTFGLVAFIPALHAAIALRRLRLWVWAGSLIVAEMLAWSLTSGTETNPDGTNTAAQDAGVLMFLILAVVGTVHAFQVRDEVFNRSTPQVLQLRDSVESDPAVVTSLAARRRRTQSAALSAADPGLARDLRIGRPDLARDYDDGGLVDVNHVPEEYLVSHLGLPPEQAHSIIEARESIGGFQVLAELSGFAEVPAATLEAIEDRVVLL